MRSALYLWSAILAARAAEGIEIEQIARFELESCPVHERHAGHEIGRVARRVILIMRVVMHGRAMPKHEIRVGDRLRVRDAVSRERYLAELEAIAKTDLPPSAENVTSAENSTTPSAENVTTPSAENSTTENHQIEPPREISSVSTSPGRGAPVDNSTAIDFEAVKALREASRARLALKGLTITAPIVGGTK